jgi:hypothetical protein
MYRRTGAVTGFVLFGMTAFGRLMWLEYRDYFGWARREEREQPQRLAVFAAGSLREATRNALMILYIWNNTFLLLAALLYVPLRSLLRIDPLEAAFLIVALINNLPWVAIVMRGFTRALRQAADG